MKLYRALIGASITLSLAPMMHASDAVRTKAISTRTFDGGKNSATFIVLDGKSSEGSGGGVGK